MCARPATRRGYGLIEWPRPGGAVRIAGLQPKRVCRSDDNHRRPRKERRGQLMAVGIDYTLQPGALEVVLRAGLGSLPTEAN